MSSFVDVLNGGSTCEVQNEPREDKEKEEGDNIVKCIFVWGCTVNNKSVFSICSAFMGISTCGDYPPCCSSVAAGYGRACATERRTADRHCNGVAGEARPGNGGALTLGHHDNAGEKGECHGDAVAQGCGCHGTASVQAQGCRQGWLEELSSGRSGMSGESRYRPRGENSARTGHRLDRSQQMDKCKIRGLIKQ